MYYYLFVLLATRSINFLNEHSDIIFHKTKLFFIQEKFSIRDFTGKKGSKYTS